MKKLVLITVSAFILICLGACNTQQKIIGAQNKQKTEDQKIVKKLNNKIDSLAKVASKLQGENRQLLAKATTMSDNLKNKVDSLIGITSKLQGEKPVEKDFTSDIQEVKKESAVAVDKKDSAGSETEPTKIVTPPKKQSQAQPTPYLTSGRWFWTSVPNIIFSMEKNIEIATICCSGCDSTKAYHLSSGEWIKITYPQLWLSTMLKCYQAIDSAVTRKTLIEKMFVSRDTVWTKDMPLTFNCYISPEGKFACIPNYNGSVHGIINVGTFMGFPVEKEKYCGNPQLLMEKLAIKK